ncbi:hypothetical protein PU634_05190 [Oceanimonas pelagia]|uniref:Uncharacterized protein n=1 Tax=Oceanimonas pelagia TaxID=3028314 RepID=A0AA50KR66_9GAMM|nr:hypothetical protein [Oceanimonas pelagia]WMC11763.1 hypothetical protein PU634_05190 [Oceanimonas pelagia]
MELLYDKDKVIRGDLIKRAVLRSDLVPVPLTLEAEIRADREVAQFLEVGQSITTYIGDQLEIIKSEYVPSGKAQGGAEAAFVRLIAVLKPVQAVSFIKTHGIVRYNATLAEIYRAAGATLRSIEGDFAVSRFACLAGEVPTYHIARALQEAGGVVRWNQGRLGFVPLPALFQQATYDSLPSHAADKVNSGFLERHEIPAFYSLDANGQFVFGNRNKPRALRYQPGATETTLRNMTSCLVLTRTARYKYAPSVTAGMLFGIEGGSPLVVMTAASLWEAGTDGEPPNQYTKLWLGRFER